MSDNQGQYGAAPLMADEFFKVGPNSMTAVRRGKHHIIRTFALHPWNAEKARALLVEELDKEEAYLAKLHAVE